MKEKRQPMEMRSPIMAIPVMPVKKSDYVNCSKCGASLSASNTAAAYVCPVCGTLFRTRKSIRIVQEVPVQEKQIHISFTKRAAMFIAGRNPDHLVPAGGKKWTVSSSEKARVKRERAFGAVLSAYIEAALYGAEKNPEVLSGNNPTKRERRKQARILKKRSKMFGPLVTQQMDLADFTEGDVLLIDYADDKLVITKKEKPTETTAE